MGLELLGQYHQYDSMVYPETKTKKLITKVWNYIVGSRSSSNEGALVIPDHDSMQEKAMEVYLDTYRKKIVGLELSSHLNIVQIAKEITYIFKQLYEQKISESREDVWRAGKLPQVKMCAHAACNVSDPLCYVAYIMHVIML